MDATRILLVDDHAVVRAGIRALLESAAGMRVVGEAGTGADGVSLTAELVPDVVVLDLTLGDQSGIAVLSSIRSASPAVRVVALTVHSDPTFLRAFLAAGGAGYVNKDAPAEELLAAIRAVMAGRSYVSMSLRDGGVELAPAAGAARGLATLSRREREVLQHVAHGFTHEEIAGRLGISVKTVEGYRSRVVAKLGLRTRADVVRFALENGLMVAGQRPLP